MVSEECDVNKGQVQLDCTNKTSFSPVQKVMKTIKKIVTTMYYGRSNTISSEPAI